MKKIVLFATLLVCSVAALAQSTMLSPRAAMLLADLNGKYSIGDLDGRYHFVRSQGETYVQAIAMLAEGLDAKVLDAYGIKTGTCVSNRAMVLIPVGRYADVVTSGLCSQIEIAQEVKPLLDRARAELGVDYIHQGLNLPQGYDGTGVVVGVIDIGIEYGHPSFYDSTGTVLRIKRVWQQNDTTGTAPVGFGYGSEYATQEEILSAVTDNPNNGHGSHTTGIAAGCGAPDEHGRRYRGIAPAADIVIVGCDMSDFGVEEGIRYIHEYARSVNKPCVVNMSLGSLMGPHDGRSVYELMTVDYVNGLDSIVLVASAGNNGGDKCHIEHQFVDDTLRTSMTTSVNSDNYINYIDCWGDEGDDFSLSVTLSNFDSDHQVYSPVESTPFISTAVDSVYTFQMRSPRDTVYNVLLSVTHSDPNNQRPEIFVMIHKSGYPNRKDIFSLTATSASAHVHLWNDREEFRNREQAEYTDGDNEYTIGGCAANTEAVISVGSYASRTKYLSDGRGYQYGQELEGDLSTFSSRGPTVDGRVKPDICATGQMIVSAINAQYIPLYLPSLVCDSTVFDGQTYYYALMQGTSMSSPAAAGIVALWLQRNPSLNVDSVRTLLHNSGRKDRFTGSIPATGSNLWGWGKIDAFAGLPAPTVPMYYLDVASNNWHRGIASGSGRYPQGQYTIEAIAANGFEFIEWSDGNRDNPRVLNLNSDTTLFAQFEEIACDTISQFPWEAEFTDEALVCWEKIFRAGVAEWTSMMGSVVSVLVGSGVDNWLITPHIIPAPQVALTYNAQSRLGGDSLAVVILTADDDTVLLSDECLAANSNIYRSVDLTPYVGQIMRVGFRHHATGVFGGMLSLNSIRIEQLQGIGDVADGSGVSVYTVDGRIQVRGAEGMEVRVYDMMGRRVCNEVLPTGVYVVKVGEMMPRKVMIVR